LTRAYHSEGIVFQGLLRTNFILSIIFLSQFSRPASLVRVWKLIVAHRRFHQNCTVTECDCARLPKSTDGDFVFEKVIACFKLQDRNLYQAPDFVLCDVAPFGRNLDLLVKTKSKELLLKRLKKLNIPSLPALPILQSSKLEIPPRLCRLAGPSIWPGQQRPGTKENPHQATPAYRQ
jgi:hypothetical protein